MIVTSLLFTSHITHMERGHSTHVKALNPHNRNNGLAR